VNQVTPGEPRLRFGRTKRRPDAAMAALEKTLSGMTALGCMGEAEEIARAALSLASDKAFLCYRRRDRRRRRRDRGPGRRAGLSSGSEPMMQGDQEMFTCQLQNIHVVEGRNAQVHRRTDRGDVH
jgi:chorismate-pyruvate lyase